MERRARMQNAHLRMGTLTFVKQPRDTVIDVTVHGRRTPRSGKVGRAEPLGSRGSLLGAIDAILITRMYLHRPGALTDRSRPLRILCHDDAVQGKLTDARGQIPGPFCLVRPVNYAAKKSKTLGDVGTVGKDLLAGCLSRFVHPDFQAVGVFE